MRAVKTDDGVAVPAGSRGTVVAIYGGGAAHEVRTGNIFRNRRVWAHLDLLPAASTIAETRDLTKAREEAAQ